MKRKLMLATLCASSMAFAGDFTFSHYGFFKAGLSQSDNLTNSFGTAGMRAPTEAANQDESPVAETGFTLQNGSGNAYQSVQSAQTRWGLKVKNGEGTWGKLEFDAAGASGGAPAAASSRVRVRQAYIGHKLGTNTKIMAGQKWVTFGGLNPHVVNMVGAGYRSGNSGFIGNEIALSHSFAEFFKATLAIGNKGASTSTPTDTETGLPLQTIRLDYKRPNHHFGVAYVTAELERNQINGTSASDVDVDAFGMKAFYSVDVNNFNIRAEYFTGQNLNDLGFVTLASAPVSAVQDEMENEEMGYFVSAQWKDNNGSLHIGYGTNEIDDETKVATGTLVTNKIIRIGGEYNMAKGLSAFFNQQRFNSGYVDINNTTRDSKANVTELGMLYRF